MSKSWIGSLFFICLLGCASGRVVPNHELKATIENPGSTLLLFAVDTTDYVNTIHISGPSSTVVKALPYQFIELAPGEYEISKLDVSDGYYKLGISDDEIWKFNIKPGVINYVGHFQVRDLYDDRYAFSLENKSTTALKYMESKHPALLSSKQLVYGGLDSDQFFDFIRKLEKKKND